MKQCAFFYKNEANKYLPQQTIVVMSDVFVQDLLTMLNQMTQ